VSLLARLKTLLAAPEPAWDDVEETLLRADVGPAVAHRIVRDLRDRRGGGDPATVLEDELVRVLDGDAPAVASVRPEIVLVVGVNGAGKTTTIGKLAARATAAGRRVAVANTDTYRAAAGEQSRAWAERAGADFVSQERGADPGAVAFDAVKAAIARDLDLLLVDTAGRLHTKEPLMEELRKVRWVVEKAAGRAPDETLLVLDATAGQNGIAQARAFTEAVAVTGIVLTKLDGTAGGGIVLAVREELGVPVRFVGTGESADDLEPFDARAFAKRLVGA
jgi:signal recognition particle-docking protein FtsY